MKLGDSIVWLLTALFVCACRDLSPVRYGTPDSGTKDASMDKVPDANGPDEGDGGADPLVEECRMCISGGACSAQFATCSADSKCVVAVECLTDTSCWRVPVTDITNLAPCMNACLMQAGITSQLDPAFSLGSAVLFCAQGATGCGPVCAPNLSP